MFEGTAASNLIFWVFGGRREAQAARRICFTAFRVDSFDFLEELAKKSSSTLFLKNFEAPLVLTTATTFLRACFWTLSFRLSVGKSFLFAIPVCYRFSPKGQCPLPCSLRVLHEHHRWALFLSNC